MILPSGGHFNMESPVGEESGGLNAGVVGREDPGMSPRPVMAVNPLEGTDPLTTRGTPRGTGYWNNDTAAATRTTNALDGRPWTKEAFTDTFRTTYNDMLAPGYSTAREMTGIEPRLRVTATKWDGNMTRVPTRPYAPPSGTPRTFSKTRAARLAGTYGGAR